MHCQFSITYYLRRGVDDTFAMSSIEYFKQKKTFWFFNGHITTFQSLSLKLILTQSHWHLCKQSRCSFESKTTLVSYQQKKKTATIGFAQKKEAFCVLCLTSRWKRKQDNWEWIVSPAAAAISTGVHSGVQNNYMRNRGSQDFREPDVCV